MTAPNDSDRLTEAQRRYAESQERARLTAATRSQRTGLWARFNEHVVANNKLVESHREFAQAHNDLVQRHNGTRLDVRDLLSAVDIIGLYLRWQRQRIDRLERLLVASGVLEDSSLPAVGGFTRELARHDVVMHMTTDTDISEVFDLVDQWARDTGDV